MPGQATGPMLLISGIAAGLRLGEAALAVGGYSICVVPLPVSVVVDDMNILDGLSLLTTSTEFHGAKSPSLGAGGTSSIVAPDVPEDAGWEAQFAWGIYHSQVFLEVEEPPVLGAWVSDGAGSGGGVPAAMLRAEELLRAAEDAPPKEAKAKLAERALRIYYHAKWLAERNHATAAEFRYRLSASLAKQSRRSVLASHALSRLGYFLVQWSRHEEARTVLEESQRLNGKTNPLAPYLHAVLERKAAGADAAAIQEAEARILAAAKLPSEELEIERAKLAEEIMYWRGAEVSPQHCLRTTHAANALICLCAHGGHAVRQAIGSIR